ncbi:hypothetical protein SAMN02910265_01442 [Ruminococcus flavefaciens]|uniref:von Willebrand factor type A domain-containing protein n=1 Tax=Ruminococcus flavefaciens TaxID=1265 RepID=A0A1H6J305_RUMFL|nr:hypothetical protein [Ruminococcus flavefaciens]SEH55982.1 hypothetical protein SAMN02910265_01442 [Ruminococcus flavefaciens]
MGHGAWSSADWKRYSSAKIIGKKINDIYRATKIDPKYDPQRINVRESCDSEDHPITTPIIIGLDVTGSMSDLLNVTAQKLGEMVKDILERQPVEGPQIMFCAVGDSRCDRSPLQATQFESDIRIASQLTDLWFEKGGGGNGFESYPLVWYFVANKTKTDAWEKRQKKGVIFTLGDDGYPEKLLKQEIERVFGDNVREDIDTAALLSQVSRRYDVFHLMVMDGRNEQVVKLPKWRRLMGERAISVTNVNAIPEIIVSLLESVAGRDTEDIINSWDGDTQLAVRDALGGLPARKRGLLSSIIKF